MAVYRKIGGCEAPDHRRQCRRDRAVGVNISANTRKGGIGIVTACCNIVRDRRLRDLLRDLPLPDRLRRRFHLRRADRRSTVPEAPVAAAVIDLGLIALFGLQHSVMARQGFKRWWTEDRPTGDRTQRLCARRKHRADRSLHLVAADRRHRLEHQSDPPSCHNRLIWAAFWVGWLTVLVSTFLINHFELFGLQQAWFHVSGHEIEPPRASPAFPLPMGARIRCISASSSPSGRRPR